jgi:phage terminase small subunit
MPRRPHFTEKRKRFAREYAVDLNGTQAAIRAGYSLHTASSTAYKLLRDPSVLAVVHKCLEKVSEKADVTAERVLKELARIGFADLAPAVRIVNGCVRIADSDSMTVSQRAAISEISESESGIKVKLHDKNRALELLGKYLAMFTDRHEVTGEDGGPLVVVHPPAPKA